MVGVEKMRRSIRDLLSIAVFGVFLCSLVNPASAIGSSPRRFLSPPTATGLSFSKDVNVQRDLKKLRALAASAGKIRVIVGLRVPFAPEGLLPSSEVELQRTEIDELATSLFSRLKSRGMVNQQTFRKLSLIPFVAMQVTADELEFLQQQPDVLTIDIDHENAPLLAQSAPLVGATQAWASGYTGTGQTVAILDTGVDKSHPFLSRKVVSEACFSGGGVRSESFCPGKAVSTSAIGSGVNCPISYDSGACKHGTHVAGIVAGTNGSFSGVAKNAKIIAIQVFSNVKGKVLSYDSDFIQGLNRVYALRNSYSIAAVNMSLGGGSYAGYCNSKSLSAKAAIDNLRSVGIATVVASGNEGYTKSISFPACISSSIKVGATWDVQGDDACKNAPRSSVDRVACFSNSASILNLLAPGIWINSSVPGSSYENLAGTSMAAPHVAGAWALIKQKKPAATVDEVLSLLSSTGLSVTDYRNGIIKPRINIDAALSQVTSSLAITYTKAGTSAGTVSFSPAGTQSSCAASCTNSYASGTAVTLTASPSSGSTFAGWSGACTGTGSCTLTMSAARAVTATFKSVATYAITYTKAGASAGTVSFSPAGTQSSCTASCSSSYVSGTNVTLTATPASGSTFAGWSGACIGTGSCTLTMSAARTVTATFTSATTYAIAYTKAGTSAGTVSFSPAGSQSSCTASCSNSYVSGTTVTLTASPSSGSTFAGWSGACAGTGSCTLTMSEAKSVSATFDPVVTSASWASENMAYCTDYTGFYFGTTIDGATTYAFSASSSSYQATSSGYKNPFYSISSSNCTYSETFYGNQFYMVAGMYYLNTLSYSAGNWIVTVYSNSYPMSVSAAVRSGRRVSTSVLKTVQLDGSRSGHERLKAGIKAR